MINELLFLLVILLSFSFVLFSLRLGREWIIVIPPVFLIFANIFVPQFIEIFGFTTSLAVPIYASIFLATDIVAEHFGKKEAKKIIWIGFATQLALIIFSQILLKAEVLASSSEINNSLRIIFGFTPRIVFASFIAYLISQNWDIFIFHSLKQKTKGKLLWLRNNLSTITSQFIDSVIFYFVAFYGILPGIIQIIFSAWLLKSFVAIFDTPIIYLSYKIINKNK
jgi:uncharacterized integral membrane protein (TIGR00697 family)